ncbi:protein CNGC15b [Mercurialis annua]|uniref:protein CNGC15b n=1 Tax=Mercurialis annua TaxID=3986 RepID=UPI002160BD83|nr:protein CNGC15b [Mercurialis annua]XP_055960291.1 protein CNGC15b [Mercurialis annua]
MNSSMGYADSRSVRFKDDLELSKKQQTSNEDGAFKLIYKIDGTQIPESSSKNSDNKNFIKPERSLKSKVLSRVFSEDYERVKNKILDPRGPAIYRWTKIFLVACLISLFVDPLFFYLPIVSKNNSCIDIGIPLEIFLTIVRSVADVFYMVQILIRFRTAYVAPSSRVFGRGELVIDSRKIALKYLRRQFWIDIVAALPLPQVLIWLIIPNLGGSTMANTKNVLRFIIIFQYLPRLLLILPLSSRITKANGVVTETAWAGAAYNLMLYMLASHVLGACWYLLSIERQEACWRNVCKLENPSCRYDYFDCREMYSPLRESWFKSSNVTHLCHPSAEFYQFGIFGDALIFGVTTSTFFNKYFYCLWWGLKNLSSLGQNLSTTTYVGEIAFAIVIATLGLVLFALLIGNMQRYLQSTTVRLEEWRIRRTDTEQWMHHRQLPPELRQSVRKYDQYKWVATRGVDEEALLKGLPLDLRRDIKRHLCLDLVRRVPLFDQMDERTLDAICERLKPALSTQGTVLVREGDLVNEMLFIIRGHLDSYTTNGGRTGFFNSCRIGPGDFCGEELLTWALDPRPSVILPSSTRTVKTISEVEAFALRAEDLKFVASQFRRLHSKQLRQKFRFYSHQWRTWAACFIQAAWRRYKKRREAAELRVKEDSMDPNSAGSGFASSRKSRMKHSGSNLSSASSLQKPEEPDFLVDED